MCRAFHDAHGTRILVLRPDYIVDSDLGIGRFRELLPGPHCARDGWVCRHDLADAAVRALELADDTVGFDCLHTVAVGHPDRPAPDTTCNVVHTRQLLGWMPRAVSTLERYRPRHPGTQGHLIDAHSHAWPLDGPLHEGISRGEIVPPSFATDELLQTMAASGVSRCVLVGHDVFHGADNSYLLDAAAAHPHAFRVTAILDETRADLAVQMRDLLNRGVTSFRLQPYGCGRECLLRRRKSVWLHDEVWAEAARSGQVLCLLVDPAELDEVSAMCERHPQARVVLDHCARLQVGSSTHAADLDKLVAMARFRNVHVKASAFYFLSQSGPPYADVLPMLTRLLVAYGSERVLWGSDAPYQMEVPAPPGSEQQSPLLPGQPGQQMTTAAAATSAERAAERRALYAASIACIQRLGLAEDNLANVMGANATRLFFFA